MTGQTPAERTLAAEVRAVTEGHHARLSGDGRTMLVKSDTRPGVTYRVRVNAIGETVSFTCDHGRYDNDGSHHPERPLNHGWVPCKHGALVARRLERRGLLRWEAGAWLPTEKSYRLGLVARPVEDPFEGLTQ